MHLNNQENSIFQLASEFINKSNHPVFLTGKAGTGKTTFLKYIKDTTLKNMAIVAPTGVAAMNAGGTTIHSFFQLPFTPFVPVLKKYFKQGETNNLHSLNRHLQLNSERKEILQQLDLLIIDEISMVRADVLDAIDAVLRQVRNCLTVPFGGVQVLYIGDMYQLPPIIRQDEWQLLSSIYSGPFFFCSQVIASQPPVYIELDRVYRQRDTNFINLLNKVRNNEMDQQGYDLLHSRYQHDYIADVNARVITLTTHNANAEVINSDALKVIDEKIWSFSADIEGAFFESTFPADEILNLKVGAQVMFIKNDPEKIRRYYNGKIGIVHKIESDNIWVECFYGSTKQLIEIKKERWRNIKYTLNKKTCRIEEEELGSFTQYPLRLAWAITIHKSQGLTFEKAVIDAGQAFSPGQVYVALSRCTSLEGLHLLSKISYNSLQSDPRIVSFAKNQQTIAEQSALLKKASLQYENAILQSIFDFNKEDKELSSYKSWVIEPQHFKGTLTEWLQELEDQWIKIFKPGSKFLGQINNLTSEIQDNAHLQQRVIAASGYFINELNIMVNIIQRSPTLTDNRQLAKDHDTKLHGLLYKILCKINFMEGCKGGFSLEIYQKQKSKFIKKDLAINSYSGKSSFISKDIKHPVLYNLLKTQRDNLCIEFNLPVYMVCSSSSIEQMASALPTTLYALGNIPGFGKIKLRQFGKYFIDIISSYCELHDLESNLVLFPLKKIKAQKKVVYKQSTKAKSFELYTAGKTIFEIAGERKLTVSTIEGHLAHYITEGQIKIESLIDKKKISIIKNVKQASGSDSITKLKDLLPGITYGELRLFLASEKCQPVVEESITAQNHPVL